MSRKLKFFVFVTFLALITLPVVMKLKVEELRAQIMTVKSILNNVWDRDNSRLMTTPWAGAQGAMESETAIFNNVWDRDNNMLRTSGGGGGGGSPGGSNTQVQFNDGGSFGGDAGLTYNKTTNTLTADVFVGALTGNVTGNASTATALAANPTDCSTNQYANAIAASGNLSCSAVGFSQLSGSLSAGQAPDAAADGSTKGISTFTAADFNSSSGVISLDYTNGQASSSSNNGFLSSTDWTTFNNKVSTSRTINTTSPLTGGGDLSADRTVACATCVTSSASLTNRAPVIGVGSQGSKTTAALTNGQLLIGSTGADPVPATLTAGTNITITNSAGSIMIDAAGGGGSSGNNNALFTSTANAANNATATDTSIIGTGIGSKTTAANYFASGTSLMMIAEGYLSTALTPDSLTVKMKAGSTVVGATSGLSLTGSLSNSTWRLIALITCRTAGASGTFQVNTIFEVTGSGLAALEGPIVNTSTITLDTTGTLAWDITAAWGSTTAGDIITGTNFVMYTPGTGMADPGTNGVLYRSALNTTAAATGSQINAPLVCAAGSASGTTYTCSTSPTFTPGSNDRIEFVADVANTGSATLNVNSAGAKTIKKQGGGTNLVANDLLANQRVMMAYDGTNWQMMGPVGNAAAGSSPLTTKGDVYTYSTVDARLAIGNDGYMLTADSSAPTGNSWKSSIDPITVRFTDDFPAGGTASSGSIGTMGWVLRGIVGGCSTPVYQASSFPHIGIVRTVSGATSGNGCWLVIDQSAVGYGDLAANTNWEMFWIISPPTVTTIGYRIGLVAANTAVAQPTSLLTMRFDTSLSDTTWQFCRRAASDTENCIDSTVTPSAGAWYKLRLWSVVAGTINFSVNGGATKCFTSAGSGCDLNSQTIPSASMTPGAGVVTRTSSAGNIDVDYFGFAAYATNR